MSYDLVDLDDELEIQAVIRSYFEQEKFGPIVEENALGRFPQFQQHQYLLLDVFTAQISILNSRLLNANYRESPDKIINLICEDFLARYDRCLTNADVHNLLFAPNTKMISLTRENGTTDDMVSYRVIDTNYATDCRNNVVTVIKEKVIRLHPRSDDYQKPDFAIYMNGIPFIAVEVKNPTRTAGIHAALLDYRQKKTYHKFLACLCTDGTNAGLCANPNALSVDNWKAYGNHGKNNREPNGLFDLLDELVFNVKNMTFYFQYGLFPVTNDSGGSGFLGNLRVHQYYVTKAAVQRLENNELGEIFREVIKQPPRSGKTIAIRSIINVISDRFPNLFDKIFIQVPDLTIADQFYSGLSAFKFSNGFQVRRVENRWKSETSKATGRISYQEAVTEGGKGVYIMNMQKISDDMRKFNDLNSKVLIFVDEVHTHQRGINAQVRDVNFPEASYFTFTATPRKRKEGKLTADLTLMEYSSSERYLDELMNEDAKDLNMVVPVIYEKAPYKVMFGEENARRFSELIEQEIRRRINEDPEFEALIEDIDERTKRYAERLKIENVHYMNTPEEFETKVELYRHRLIDEKADRFIGRIKTEFQKRQKIERIPIVIQHITRDLQEKVDDNYSDINLTTGERQPRFVPKAFLVVDNQTMADEVARYISTTSAGTNVINGFKFGLDYSENMNFDGASGSMLSKFNSVKYGNSVKDDFDTQAEDSIQILIIVGKYLMGYDNKQLVSVYCYTSMQEPARIFQLYTRPATKLAGKELGFFVDMCFGNENYDAYNEAVKWYEGGTDSSILYLTEDQLEGRKQSLWVLIDTLARVLNMNRNDIIRPGRERNLLVSGVGSEQQAQALNICREIGRSVKGLLSPKYYREFLEFILAINKAIFGLANHLKANSKQVVFSNKDISNLLDEFLGILNLEISDIMDIELQNGKIVKVREDRASTQSVVVKHLAEVRNILRSSKGFIGGDIFNRLRRMADEIDDANKWDEDTEHKSQSLLEETRKALNEVISTIRVEFDLKPEWYVTYHVFKNVLEARGAEINSKSATFKEFTRKFAITMLGYVTRNTRAGKLEVCDSSVNEAVRDLKNMIAEFHSRGDDQPLCQAMYNSLSTHVARQDAERLVRSLFRQIYEKKYELQKHT